LAQVEGGDPNAALSDGTWKTLGRFNTLDQAQAAEAQWNNQHPGNLRLTRELQVGDSQQASNSGTGTQAQPTAVNKSQLFIDNTNKIIKDFGDRSKQINDSLARDLNHNQRPSAQSTASSSQPQRLAETTSMNDSGLNTPTVNPQPTPSGIANGYMNPGFMPSSAIPNGGRSSTPFATASFPYASDNPNVPSNDSPSPAPDTSTPVHGTTGLNVRASIQALDANADNNATYTGHCSGYVAQAINAGLPPSASPLTVVDDASRGLLGPASGGRMGQVLENAGFANVTSPDYQRHTGDVAVIQNGRSGHVAMWDGQQWVSDTKQPINASNSPNPGGRSYTNATIQYYRP
jgi:hypothetical protein